MSKKSPNLTKSEPTGSSIGQGGIGIAVDHKLGETGGVEISGRLRLGTEGLIPKQGLGIEVDATNNTTKMSAGLGSAKGKLGASIGVTMGYDEYGNQTVKSTEIDVNIAGFGAGIEVDDEGNRTISGSVGGIKVEVTSSSDGSRTLAICYAIPGGEICVEAKDPKEPIPQPTPPGGSPKTPGGTPTLTPPPTRIVCSTGSWIVGGYGARSTGNENVFLEGDAYLQHLIIGIKRNFDYYTSGLDESACDAAANSKWGSGKWTRTEIEVTDYFPWHIASNPPLPAYVGEWYYLNNNGILSYGGRRINETGLRFWMKGMWTTTVADYRANNNSGGFYSASYNWRSRLIEVLPAPPCPSSPTPTPTPEPTKLFYPLPPNQPNKIKPMTDCCELVKEIHKHLGIGKFKQRGFSIDNAMLVAKGTGTQQCKDMYEVWQNSFRMLANTTIVNPISKPLGTEYQNVNATSWAAEIYEMVAEARSDGNSTQRFEMHMTVQIVQMMKIIAELSSKLDFVTLVLGITPIPKPGKLPVLFTIHEDHKAFDPSKKPKEINIKNAKTDEQVEVVLGKMFNPSEIPYTQYTFSPNSISIAQAISKL